MSRSIRICLRRDSLIKALFYRTFIAYNSPVSFLRTIQENGVNKRAPTHINGGEAPFAYGFHNVEVCEAWLILLLLK